MSCAIEPLVVPAGVQLSDRIAKATLRAAPVDRDDSPGDRAERGVA